MTYTTYWLKFILLVIAQALLCTYFTFSHLIMLTFLPAIILFLPTTTKTSAALVVAFFSGLVVDFLSSGAIGITSASLLVCALTRKAILSFVFGEEMLSRAESLSLRKKGGGKISLALLMITAIFLLVYITLDSAGTRSFGFNATKFALSLASDVLLGFAVASFLCSNRR